MQKEELLDEFGQMVVRQIRDPMIESLNKAISGEGKSIYSRWIHELLKERSDECKRLIDQLVPYIIDGTILGFLGLFDGNVDSSLEVLVRDRDGVITNLGDISDGLAGEYSSSKGWVSLFSTQRPDEISLQARNAFEAHNKPPWGGDKE